MMFYSSNGDALAKVDALDKSQATNSVADYVQRISGAISTIDVCVKKIAGAKS